MWLTRIFVITLIVKPIDTVGGGGLEFLAINVRQFFFYVMSKNVFVVCFPYYVRYHLVFFLVNIFFINFDNKLFFSAHITYHLVFFLVNIFFINFDNKLFFSAHIFNKLFFFNFCGDKLFFSILI